MRELKKRLKSERNPIIAFDSGYTKSRTTILDANITTLIAAVILFFMGSGPIKGFSITLGVGILTTLFSVYFIARLFTAFYVIKNKDKEALILMREISFNKFYKLFNILSIILIIASLGLLMFKGLNYGVDFKGGTLIELRTDQNSANITKIRDSFNQMN